ncbi:Dispatched-like protein [Dinothrombium tinctorium]|uniref:Dispatched-like protein n=1 Tax=Dinothrombium tinctorium TaxID=1965070 RepID=A0A3S3RMC0_9ACAR|nr:Dispatched-like protein [Dinothrombium tinctorium]RWS07564.1 Dispatched-like protein [Dinothrombium tinctorium]
MQLFRYGHPFEQFELFYKRRFKFAQELKKQEDYGLPVRIIFGLIPEDNGSHLNPFDRGSLTIDDDFNVTSPQAQVFLLQLCTQFRNQSFYKSTLGPLLNNCFLETLYTWLNERKCIDPFDLITRYPCCNESHFPYNKQAFDFCLKKAIKLMFKGSYNYIDSKWAGAWFEKQTNHISVVVIEYNTIFNVDADFTTVNFFWKKVNSWLSQIKTSLAQNKFKNAFAVADNLDLYALQEAIVTGTMTSVFLALAIAFIGICMTTFNFRLIFIAILTISWIMFTTIAILILSGWKLDVIESICICVAIGLSVDSTLHYVLAYQSFFKVRRNYLTDLKHRLFHRKEYLINRTVYFLPCLAQ